MDRANCCVLILGEDAETARCLALELRHQEYAVEVCPGDHSGPTHLRRYWPDLVVAATTSDELALWISNQIREWSAAPHHRAGWSALQREKATALWRGADDGLDTHVSSPDLSLRIDAVLKLTLTPLLPP